ncbi:MAG: ABC transporter ATP-binding protein [Candidatus Solibacter sp.]|jgi:ABC-type polysaccharide/polyol phosphate transport system ATPase subunit
MLLRSRVAHWLKGDKKKRFYALKNVSFSLDRGEGLAVVGPNGAGKSTLLSLVVGLVQPNEGHITVTGRIAALLELGSGFHIDLTGRENIFLNASLLGLTRKRTIELFDEIVDFADIGDFIGEPMRTYSTGMIMRLAFSVAVNMDPEILIVDEVLAVGDAAFQAKCFAKVREFRHAGKTLLCVSHAVGMVQELCDRAIWLDHGELVMTGTVRDVTEAYAGHMTAQA